MRFFLKNIFHHPQIHFCFAASGHSVQNKRRKTVRIFNGLNRLALIAPNVNVNIIKDYKVVKKYKVALPDDIMGIVKCNNPKCITNNEPMLTHFHVEDKDNVTLRCHYCERTVVKNDIVLK